MYHSTVHPYCTMSEDQLRARVIFPEEFQTAPASVKARVNMRLLANVYGDFFSPHTDEFNKMFSLDQYGLLRQIPTESGWICGGVTHEVDVHVSLYQNPSVHKVQVESRFEAVTPVIREVIDAMQLFWDTEQNYFEPEFVSSSDEEDDDSKAPEHTPEA